MEVSLARKEPWKQSLIYCWRFLSLRRLRAKGKRGWRLELFLQRTLLLGLIMAVLGYGVAVVALYSWRSTVPFNQVRLVDIAFPWNWSHMKQRLSLTDLERAKHHLEEKEFREAYIAVTAATGRDPKNFEARLLRASMMAGSDPENAIRMLRSGYRVGMPADENYNSLFLALSLRLEDFDSLREVLPLLIQQLHKQERTEEVTRRLSSYYVVLLQSQMKLRDYVSALRTLEAMEKDNLQVAILPLRLLLLIRMGSFEEFDRTVAALPLRERDSAPLLMLRAQAAYERNEIQNAETYIGRALSSPQQNWNVYMDGIKLLLRMGQVQKAEEYVDLFLHYNGNNQQAIQRLAAALTDWPSSYLVSKIKLWSVISNNQLYPMLLFFEIQALFREGNFIDAKNRFDSWVMYVPQTHKDYRYVTAYSALFDAVLADSESTRSRLLDTLQAQVRNGTPFQEEIYWVAADAMRKVGRYDLAETIIAQGMSVYPNTLTLGSLRRKLREERAGIQSGAAQSSPQRRASGWESDADTPSTIELLNDSPISNNGSSSVIFSLD